MSTFPSAPRAADGRAERRRLHGAWRRLRVRLVGWLALLAAGSAGVAWGLGRGEAQGWALATLAALTGGWAAVRAVRAAERPARDLTRFLGGVRYDDVSATFSAPGGDPLLDALADAFSSVGDAFRRVRAEREEQAGYLEAVVRHVGVALVAFRADGTVTLFNLAAGRTLGMARPRSLDALARRAPEVTEALRGLRPGERQLLRVEAAEGPQELVAYATRFTLANEAHTLVSLQDIHDELEARELEAWQQLSRVLTHEITNSVAPIASLAGTARDRLGEGAPPAPEDAADVREALGTIERRSRRLVAFVDAYRSLARLPAPQTAVISLGELLGDVALLARATAPGVEVAVSVDPPDLELVADPELVEQALVNLALNGAEALAGRSGARLVLRAAAGPSGRPIVEVVDNGPGLLPEVLDRVFVPFFSTKAGGSGIGLSLASRIARLHGGTLTVDSEPDVRTTFSLRL